MNEERREPLTDDINPIFDGSPDNKDFNLIIYKNDIIEDENGKKYQILKKLGEGQFGQVFAVFEVDTKTGNQIYALKITKSHPQYREQAQKEVELMAFIRDNSSEEEMENILRYIRSFFFKNHLVIMTEKLSVDLITILKYRNYDGLPLSFIQPAIRTILKALSTLSRLNIVHSDLKPENILLIDNMSSSKVKIVDFGSSRFISQKCTYYIQSRFYRAPEVILAIPHSYPVDIWSLGCVAAELFVGLPLFPGQNEVQMMLLIVRMLGQIPQKLIDMSPRKNVFFNSDGSLKTEIEICSALQKEVVEMHKYFYYRKLPDIIKQYVYNMGNTSTEQTKEQWRRKLFIDLLKKMLVLDPEQRITPDNALKHPFITTDLQYS